MRCVASSLKALLLLSAAVSHAAGDENIPTYEQLPKIDVHSHVFEDFPALNDLFRKINMRTVNICVPAGDGHFEEMHRAANELSRKYPELYPCIVTFDLRGHERPDYAEKVIAWLDGQFALGTVGVKIWKEVGMEIRDHDGGFVLPDDPRFDPVYAHLAKVGKPLHAHLAEPVDAWLPLDPASPYYSYYSRRPEWHFHAKPGVPTHAELIAARDNIMKKHPTLVVVGAHLASLGHDLNAIAERLDRFPNFHIEVAARARDLVRHPSDKVRAFFLKYPDRIMYGLDVMWKPFSRRIPPTELERRSHLQMLERRYREDFEYYVGQGEMNYEERKVAALHLPHRVLEQFYNGNARRLYKLDAVPGSTAR
jgi:hypothetical protein